MSRTVSDTEFSTVTLTSTADNPVTVTPTGDIEAFGAQAIFADTSADQAWTIDNQGMLGGDTGIQIGTAAATAHSTASNEGTILAGTDGVLSYSPLGFTTAGLLEANVTGVDLEGGGTVINTAAGTIIGDSAAINVVDAAIIENDGTIESSSAAITAGNAAVTLMEGTDASLFGTVNVGTASSLDLVTGTATSGTFSGIGSSVTGFSAIDIAGGATWALGGTQAGLSEAAVSSITGLAAGDTIDVTDFAATSVAYADNTLTLGNASGSVALAVHGNYSTADFSAVSDGAGGTLVTVACFCAGTRIATPSGPVAVEALAIGGEVLTADGRSAPVKWIGRRSYGARFVAAHPALAPIRIAAGALGEGLPERDLLVSPKHAMLLDGYLVPAEHLVNDVTIVREPARGEVYYFHIELERHDIVLAEGAASETFVDDEGRGLFHNASEFAALYPDHMRTPAVYYAPRLTAGHELEAIRRRVAAVRAA